jgi:hypothetical protein
MLTALLIWAAQAQAAGPPSLGAVWATDVSASSATLHGEVNPNAASTTYRFEYITDNAYQENISSAKEPFTGATRAPAGGSAQVGSGSTYVVVFQHLSALRSGTKYHYRLAATNASGPTLGSPLSFTTQEISGAFQLPDGRGYEMVSPVEKNGGAIQAAEQIHGGGVLIAAAAGGAITYTSSSSFGEEAEGAPPGSQYISRRSGGSWSTEDISIPVVSGSYGNNPNGVPYQLFSSDLVRALMLNGIHCRGEGSGCPVANPPIQGSGAPSGFQNYYLRDNEAGSFAALITTTNTAALSLDSSQFSLAFAGASPDLFHVVISTCAKLTADATETPGVEGCDPNAPNLYEYSAGQLSLINLLPGQSQGTPGAALGAQAAAISDDGSRVYFGDGGSLYLREGSTTKLVAEGGEFQTATPNGGIALYTNLGHLYSYSAATHTSSDLTPGGEVTGVMGASQDGSIVYYETPNGVYISDEGSSSKVASQGLAGDSPPTTGTSRVSADGLRLLFLTNASLTGYDNMDQHTGEPDTEAFLYSNPGHELACISCNPTGERPLGSSSIPGAEANGVGTTDAYKPRALTLEGGRVFFDSNDSLLAPDTNGDSDVYEWEAAGQGSCSQSGGCLYLLSNGKDPEGASFVDASESGADAYFLTYASLVEKDPGFFNVEKVAGAADVYDARVGGSEPVIEKPIECEGDACTPLPAEPEDPTVGSLIPGLGDPPVHFPKVHHRKVKKHHKRKHRHHKRNRARGGRR